MKTHVLRGSKQEIAESLVWIAGEVREATAFEGESTPVDAAPDVDDIFAEMRDFMVDFSNLDDSRESIYSLRESE